ncbi:hypothetical protein BDN70DRAFT_879248 [Pholiota conissans]|uniref:Uncharacterized protein n=1 Tax=Pholiota conissans TaxID=109636 RepID=A0A9P5Z2A5_9AGAR|nr:hypothetical protein BDN70DRAFT_879248 [Pholiota conissans]
MATSVRLPLEILESVVEMVAEDYDRTSHESVKQCALVCHDFLHFSRKVHFGVIVLPSYEPYRPSAVMLHKLLSTTPKIAAYIRHLEFHVHSSDFDNVALSETFGKITRLKTLTLSFPEWYEDARPWKDILIRPLLLHLMHNPTLTHLKLASVENFAFADLARCVNLENLDMYCIRYEPKIDDPVSESDLPTSSIRLPSLSVTSIDPLEISRMCALRRADGGPLIDTKFTKELTLDIGDPEDFPSVRKLFDAFGNLTTINMDILVSDATNGEDLTKIGLASVLLPTLKKLKHLSFGLEIYQHDPLGGLSYELEALQSNVIETLDIDLKINYTSLCTRGNEWTRLDSVLTRKSVWRKLKDVILTIGLISLGDEDWTRALSALPQTHLYNLMSSKDISFYFEIYDGRL